jgi:hypothetical protein
VSLFDVDLSNGREQSTLRARAPEPDSDNYFNIIHTKSFYYKQQ